MGGISIVSLFINLNSLSLFLFKFIISVLMSLISFNYKNIKYTLNNLVYLYLVSILLGGFLYFINDSFSYKNTGFIFYHNGFSINVILSLLITPIILFFYVKQNKKIKEEYNNTYYVDITFLNGEMNHLIGYLDTGNNLIDPYKRRPIIIINSNVLKEYKPRTILVPCITINKTSMIKCFKIKQIIINKKIIKKEILVGISDNKFNLDGVDLLLNKKII